MSLSKTVLQLIDLGKKDFESPEKRRMYRIANLFTLNAIFWMLFSVAVDLISGNAHKSQGVFVLPFLVLFEILVLIINRKGNPELALTLLNVSTNIVLTYFSIRGGEESLVHVHFISAIIGTTIMFSGRDSLKFYYLNLLFLAACIITTFLFFMSGQESALPKEMVESSRDMHVMIVMFLSVLFSFVVINTFSRKQKELRKALEEKEILLSEVFHWVKNNMAVILGLINLKKNQSENPDTIEALAQCHMRVMSMAMVHNRIYKNKSLHHISLDSYLNELADEVMSSLKENKEIELTKDLSEVNTDITIAIPVGLITNEVLTNSYKHAFSNGKGKVLVEIRLHATDPQKAQLRIRDNGPGLPLIDPANTDSLGMTLIHSLCEQIDAKYRFINDGGLVFEMEFPLS